ncbi:MAG TPA: hypothetical protein VK116_05905, partial [Planctomycetota bacterium]|nr:hypothetical protein [Planctomycetota bacterium]
MARRALVLIALSVVLAMAPERGFAQDAEGTDRPPPARTGAEEPESPRSPAASSEAETPDSERAADASGDAGASDASAPGTTPSPPSRDSVDPDVPSATSDSTPDAPSPNANGVAAGETADLYRPLGPNLFPFYVHELRTSDQTEITEVLWLYGSTSRPDGSSSLRILPFFWRVHQVEPPDDRLFVFPFWYSRTSPEASSLYLFPFYWHHETPNTSFDLLVPLWLRRSDEVKRTRDLWVVPPLYRTRFDGTIADRPVVSHRLGLWRILELWESRETPNTIDRTAINLLNWGQETESGLALYRSRWVREDWGEHGSRYLFPFLWQGTAASSGYLWLVPLFGYSADGDSRDWTLIPLLSRYGYGPGPARRLDVLFPLFHYARDEESFSIASYPFFDWHESGAKSRLGVLFWLYRRYVDEEAGTRSHNILFPLSSFRSAEDGAVGRNWLFPYYEDWNRERRYRMVAPVHYHWRDIVDGKDDWYFTWTAPTYFSWGTPEDSFAFGFPLYWASTKGQRSWAVAFPLYWRFRSQATDSFDLIPLYSYRVAPHGSTRAFLGPLYAYQRFYDADESLRGTAHHFLWPIFKASFLRDGHDWRFLPFFWTFRHEDRSGALITPFWYRESGPSGTFSYLFPIRAVFTSPREVIDYRALGAWVRHDVKTESGALASRTTHWLWWLATFEDDRRESLIHRRILPLGYWHTETPSRHRTVLGPFWYSHSIPEHDSVHHLDLFLGNLFLSKVVEEIAPERKPLDSAAVESSELTAPGDERALGESDGEGAKPSDGPSDPTVAPLDEGPRVPDAPPSRVVRSIDRGVLWPLTRWYRDDRGSSGRWILPFWFQVENPVESRTGVFPLFYGSRSNASYDPSYFRYFYLFNRESYAGGSRTTVGQLLFDWRTSDNGNEHRLRLLYPLFEMSRSEMETRYQFTPLIAGESTLDGGVRRRAYRIFPIFWAGDHERLDEGEWVSQRRYFYLFPLWGYQREERRTDYSILYPLFQLQIAPERFDIDLWPIVFYRERPALNALRLWPLHAHETGEAAGDFWVSRYLFLSKWFKRHNEREYRLDPFLFRYHRDEESFGIGGLFEALAYDRSPDRTSFRIIPFVFGHASKLSATTAVIPFHYNHDFGEHEIDFWHWPRFFFLTSRLSSETGERRFGFFANLFDYTWNERRPEYSEFRILHRFVFDYHSESARQFEINPLFQYYRDDIEGVRS